MELTLQWDRSALRRLRGAGLEKALVRAVALAGGDAIRAVRVASQRGVRFRKRLRLARVNRSLRLSYPKARTSLEALVWRLDVSGEPMPAAEYPGARNARKLGGVRVNINRGRPALIKGAFLATMSSGHVGIFERAGRGRLPLKQVYTTRVSDVFRDSGAAPAFLAAGQRKFAASFARLLPLEIQKLRRGT